MGVALKGRRTPWPLDDSLRELAQLAATAGADVVGKVPQNLESPSVTYLGKGKVEELKLLQEAVSFDTIICDDELTPTQQRNLERAFGERIKVIPNFIDTDRYRRGREPCHRSSLAPSSEKIVMHVSNFRPVMTRASTNRSADTSRSSLSPRASVSARYGPARATPQ